MNVQMAKVLPKNWIIPPLFFKIQFFYHIFKNWFLMLHILIPSGDNHQSLRGLFLSPAKLLCNIQNLREELTDNLEKDNSKPNSFEKLWNPAIVQY